MTKTITLFICLCAFFTTAAQPAAVEWLKKNNTNKSVHTLQLLQAGPDGFSLLREKTEPGKNPVPYFTQLDITGGEVYDQPIPGFDQQAGLFFRFAMKGTGSMLLFYEKKGADHTWNAFVREFIYAGKTWAGTEKPVFTPLSAAAWANAETGFRVSPNGEKIILFRLIKENTSQSVHLVMFDRKLNQQWTKIATLPQQEGASVVRQYFCSNDGQFLVHARQYSAGAQLQVREQAVLPALYWPDGVPLFRNEPASAGNAPKCSNVLFLLTEKEPEVFTFFPEATMKYTRSLEIGEAPNHQIICAGMGSDESPDKVDKYFVYTIDLQTRTGKMQKSSAVPANFRKVFMSESAAEQKKPADDVCLRWVKTTPDGKIWILAEQEKTNDDTGWIGAAALLRLDSTFRIAGVTGIEKYNKIKSGERRSFATVSTCLSDKGNWWLLWHETYWPEMRLMLTPAKGKDAFEMTTAGRSQVAMVNNTILQGGDKWYFVGESEDERTYRIGVLSEVQKNAKNK